MPNIIQYTIITVLIILGFVIYVLYNRYKALRSLKQKIITQWGKKPPESFNSSELQSIASYNNNLLQEKKNVHFIDDITWNDLDMDRIFLRLNNTQSTVGEEYLYYMLHKPEFDADILKSRNNLINFFSSNSGQRIKLQLLLARLGKNKYLNVSDYFYSGKKDINIKSIYYKLLSAICILSPLSMAFDLKLGLTILIVSVIVNILVYYRAKNSIAAYLESLSYIISLVGCAKKIPELHIDEIKEYENALESSVKKVKSVINKSFWLLSTTENVFVEYVRVILLGELIAFESMFEVIHKHKEEFQKIYEIVGLLDSLIAIASYRKSIEYYTVPQLSGQTSKSYAYINFTDIYHPLISDPVPNSLDINKPVLLTGSNASGKSTFLKTVAINAIFAQTINTCLARCYNSSYFMIFSSMALKDNLKTSESYYIAEIKSLKRIFDNLNDEIPCLCLIDEVLRGTNTVERISASSEVLHNLSEKSSLCIAATHDIELASILKNSYENYHFRESFTNNEITFDYKIHPGKSNTRNAIKLLQFMGYDDKIVKSAEERALYFLNNGIWLDKY